MSIPDKAVEALARVQFDYEWIDGDWQWDEYPPELNRWLKVARNGLEAAEPYLTGESRLREALTDLIEARTNHSSPYPSDYVIEPNELRELLAATLEVKS